MEHRTLGESDLSVSVLGLGTMTFGAESDEATSHAILDRFVELGGNLIDTADVYSRGVSEEIIGRWLQRRGRRDDVVIATKARFPMSDDPADRGAGRRHLERALDASRRRLGVEVIDLYQIHAWDPETPIEETLRTLDGFVREGRVRWIGVSNFLAWQLEKAIITARYLSWAPIVSLQPQYNLLDRGIELELVPLCLEESLGILPWSPLAGGWLSGKYSPSEPPAGSTRLGEDPNRGIEAYDLKNNEWTWRILDAVREVAERRGVSLTGVSLNWLRERPGVTSVLLGCRTREQLEDNMAAARWRLTDEEMEALDTVSAPGIPLYPYGFLEVEAGMEVWERLRTRVRPPYGEAV